MPTEDSILSRLAKTILEKKEKVGSYDQLANEIQGAVGNTNEFSVDRRKLARIARAAGQPLSQELLKTHLTFNELIAFDNYLKFEGGLAAILEERNVISLLAAGRRISFFLGAKPIEDTDFISRWDVLAMEELIHAIGQTSIAVNVDVCDVFLRDSTAPLLSPDGYKQLFEHEPWFQSLQSVETGAAVCLGSPRAVNAAEIALATMFGVQPFTRAGRAKLPFMFVWSDEEYDKMPSAFALAEKEVPELIPHASQDQSHGDRKPRVAAIRLKDKYYQVNRVEDRWDTYGVIALTYGKNGRLLVVCAGLSGTGTFACASLLSAIRSDVVPRDGTVVWAPVKATVERDSELPGNDGRRVIDQELLDNPTTWPP